jgi:flagellar FliL protein
MAKASKSAEDAPAEAPEGEAAPAEGGGGRKKLIIMAAAGALALGGAGGGGWWYLKKKNAAAPADTAQMAPKKQTAFVELKEMTVNLATTPGQQQSNYLKLKVALEIGDPKLAMEVQPLVPRIEDAFQVYMRELRAGELEGSAAVFRLKEELLKRVNIAVYPAKIDAVLFKEILVQ